MEIWKEAEPFFFEGNRKIGVLVIQGFTGATGSVIDWGRGLAAAGLTVSGPRLAGHGTDWRELNRTSWHAWEDDVENAYITLSSRVETIFVAGLSMGATLACLLAQRHPEIAGLLMVNNLMLTGNPLLPLAPLVRLFVASVPAIGNDIKDKSKTEPAYSVTPTGGADEFRKLLNHVRPRLKRITQPVLNFKSREDHVVPIKSTLYTMEHLGSSDKELVWLDNSYHVATMDFDLPIIVEKSLAFIGRIAGKTR